jgi:hypothetical protein
MPIELSRLAIELVPEKTVLFFGAGACLASHAPSVDRLMRVLQGAFGIEPDGYSLREYTGIIENKYGRKKLIEALRGPFHGLKPTGSLLNLPLYTWKSIFTTNYDTLIEDSYRVKDQKIQVYESNFDFSVHENSLAVKLFKLHGSIEKDVCDGHVARIILTDNDYDHTQEYREGLYDRLRADAHGASLVIIGHSLADEDIKAEANRAAEIQGKIGGAFSVTLLMFKQDVNRAELWEKRGFQVCFGGLDDFFSAIAGKIASTSLVYKDPMHPLDHAPALMPITIDVAHSINGSAEVARMFDGWPASFADIEAGLTFRRSITSRVIEYLQRPGCVAATILGASGTGKTTAARQILLQLKTMGFLCFEHKGDFELLADDWISVAKSLPKYNARCVLFVDDAHSHLFKINNLMDGLRSERVENFKIILASSRNHWNPRVKSSALFKCGESFHMGRLRSEEVDWLLTLVEANAQVRTIVAEGFAGYSRHEKRRRILDRFDSETFVCLKNIFSSEKFDDIILREYAGLADENQDVYKIVAAMESSGIRVHRQLIIRLLGIQAATIGGVLASLTDIVSEYAIDEREGLYGWKCRHGAIAAILTKYKFDDVDKITGLFEDVVDCISPTFDIEVRTIRELCNIDTGLTRIPDKHVQNRLLRKMISVAPGERVPRHRLMRNLIEMGEFEKAGAEIRIFEKDFGNDAPTTRYKIKLLIGRAIADSGILDEDRVAILRQARDASLAAIARFPAHKGVLGVYCEVGVELYRKTGDYAIYDDALGRLKVAEAEVGDPEISKLVRFYERRMAGQVDATASSSVVDEE